MARDVAEAHALGGRARDLDPAVDHLEVFRRGLERVGRDRERARAQLLGRLHRRGAGDHRAAAPPGAAARPAWRRCRPASPGRRPCRRPSASATTWAMVVSRLCPWPAVLVSTSTWPLLPMRTVAASLVIQPNALADGSGNRLTPIPIRRPSSRHCRCCSRSAVVVDHLRGLLEVEHRGHLVVDHAARHRVGQVLHLDDVAAADLQRVDPEVRREQSIICSRPTESIIHGAR